MGQALSDNNNQNDTSIQTDSGWLAVKMPKQTLKKSFENY
jgi:hypothetical protein